MATSPVSSSDFRLERIRGQPPDMAVMSLDSSRSISWVMVSFTAFGLELGLPLVLPTDDHAPRRVDLQDLARVSQASVRADHFPGRALFHRQQSASQRDNSKTLVP